MNSLQHTYKEIVQESQIVYKQKGSKFIAYSFHVEDEFNAAAKLKGLKTEYPDATHHCYAMVIGKILPLEKSSDDGEPSNTAGKPILREMIKLGLTNTLVVVVRYFGGTQLGVPGLIEAYSEAAKQCLHQSGIKELLLYKNYELSCPYGMENEIFRLSKQFDAEIFVLEDVNMFTSKIKIPLQYQQAFENQLNLMYQISCKQLETT